MYILMNKAFKHFYSYHMKYECSLWDKEKHY